MAHPIWEYIYFAIIGIWAIIIFNMLRDIGNEAAKEIEEKEDESS